ncbi:hypothetical protein [Flavobacterium gilvum]|uniref:hypothetical protein n=1 Tax=Flavobacterium gilvum TaxID=1492737 RepID=UPI0004E44B9F|nr:hypothetical protein [Flavobacterium gilvum]KFC57821.1 hypothetical protein FEM08_33860 [Flavobacterium gilvum]
MKEIVEILTQAEILVEQKPEIELCIKYREIIRNGSFKCDEATLKLASEIIETFKRIKN